VKTVSVVLVISAVLPRRRGTDIFRLQTVQCEQHLGVRGEQRRAASGSKSDDRGRGVRMALRVREVPHLRIRSVACGNGQWRGSDGWERVRFNLQSGPDGCADSSRCRPQRFNISCLPDCSWGFHFMGLPALAFSAWSSSPERWPAAGAWRPDVVVCVQLCRFR